MKIIAQITGNKLALLAALVTICVLLGLAGCGSSSGGTVQRETAGGESASESANVQVGSSVSDGTGTITSKGQYALSEAFTNGDYRVWFFPMGWDSITYRTEISHTIVFDGSDYTCYKVLDSDDRFTLEDIDALSEDEVIDLAKKNATETTRGTVHFICQKDSSGNSVSNECIYGLPSDIGPSSSAYSRVLPINGEYYQVYNYDGNVSGTTVLSNQYFGIKQQSGNMGYPLVTKSKTSTAPKITKDMPSANDVIDYDDLKDGSAKLD